MALINPLLERLDWSALSKESRTIQGKQICPDYTLFAFKEDKDQYIAMTQDQRKDAVENIVTFTEVKVAGQRLDTRKAKREENPYLQLLEYLSLTRIPFGFLSNGVEWWLVDNEKVSANKRYLNVDLEKIIADNNEQAFHCFFYLFHRTTFRPDKLDETPIFTTLNREDAQYRKESEESLRKVIYGTNDAESLFETTGKAFYIAVGQKKQSRDLASSL